MPLRCVCVYNSMMIILRWAINKKAHSRRDQLSWGQKISLYINYSVSKDYKVSKQQLRKEKVYSSGVSKR